MNLELVVDARNTGIWLALLRDGKLIELHEERGNTDFAVGDVYLGRIRRVVPSLNAAFVDVGHEKDAFLHYLDLGLQFFCKICKGFHSWKTKCSRFDVLQNGQRFAERWENDRDSILFSASFSASR